MFDTVKNSLGSNWPRRTPTLSIEWGQIDPKGNRRVKRKMSYQLSTSCVLYEPHAHKHVRGWHNELSSNHCCYRVALPSGKPPSGSVFWSNGSLSFHRVYLAASQWDAARGRGRGRGLRLATAALLWSRPHSPFPLTRGHIHDPTLLLLERTAALAVIHHVRENNPPSCFYLPRITDWPAV